MVTAGCHQLQLSSSEEMGAAVFVPDTIPRELSKVSLPDYRIEPPDLLMIDAVHIAPKTPYQLRPFDVLAIQMRRAPRDVLREGDIIAVTVPGAPTAAPIAGEFAVQPGGLVSLGAMYGGVNVGGLTVTEAKQAIENHLDRLLADPTAVVAVSQRASPIDGPYPIQLGGVLNFGLPYGKLRVSGLSVQEAQQAIQQHLEEHFVDCEVSVSLLEVGAKQQIAGQHLVGPDGTIKLGSYGKVYVTGRTVPEAEVAVEEHLSLFLEAPEVSVNVFSYNSKLFYIITEGAGFGEQVYRLPCTGNDTVLDAIAQINGLQRVHSKRIWIARPTRPGEPFQMLPVDWKEITRQGGTATNCQILPGYRIFVAQDSLIAFDSSLQKLIAPVERVMGFTLLGTGVATRLSGRVLSGGGNPRGVGF
jgi:polysaccharide export outer membrane protein